MADVTDLETTTLGQFRYIGHHHGSSSGPGVAPQDMPDLRIELLEGWNSQTWRQVAVANSKAVDPRANGSGVVEWDLHHLARADLWWVGPEMCDLLYATSPKVPADVQPEHLVIPADSGLVFLARPWEGADAHNSENRVVVDAFVWGISRLRVPGSDRRVMCLSTSFYRCMDWGSGLSPAELAYAAQLRLHEMAKHVTLLGLADDGAPSIVVQGKTWCPLGRSDWLLGTPLDEALADVRLASGSRMAESGAEDRRLIAALFTLINTHSIATVDDSPINRQTRRRSERAGVPSKVKVVYLRRPKHTHGEHTDADAEGVRWSHRWMVSAHMRNQPYGPGRTLRRLTMIPAHQKGPADKELVIKETVRAWIR